jgi:hypothetical protein
LVVLGSGGEWWCVVGVLICGSPHLTHAPSPTHSPPTLNQEGSTALLCASDGGHTEAVKVLLEAGANKEAVDKVRLCGSAEYCVGLWECGDEGKCVAKDGGC